MMAIGHFMVGFAITLAILIVTSKNRDVEHDGIVGVFGGFFAMIPDGWRVAPDFIKSNWEALHESWWANMFFLHNLIDTVYPDNLPSQAFPFMIFALVMCLILILIEWKEAEVKAWFSDLLNRT